VVLTPKRYLGAKNIEPLWCLKKMGLNPLFGPSHILRGPLNPQMWPPVEKKIGCRATPLERKVLKKNFRGPFSWVLRAPFGLNVFPQTVYSKGDPKNPFLSPFLPNSLALSFGPERYGSGHF